VIALVAALLLTQAAPTPVEVAPVTVVAPGCLIHSPKRSLAAKYAFRKAHPCPANGSPLGACPGWQVHHLWPLCCGGPDTPDNMIWLTIAQHEVVTTKLVCKGAK